MWNILEMLAPPFAVISVGIAVILGAAALISMGITTWGKIHQAANEGKLAETLQKAKMEAEKQIAARGHTDKMEYRDQALAIRKMDKSSAKEVAVLQGMFQIQATKEAGLAQEASGAKSEMLQSPPMAPPGSPPSIQGIFG